MDSTPIRLSSHNIRGLSNSKEFLHSRCQENSNLIQCVQEHWLPPPYKKTAGTDRLRTIHPAYEGFGISAMKKAVEGGVRRGRGFGGTGFIFPKKLSNLLKPLVQFNHERVSVMELNCDSMEVIIINVYMPFLNRSNVPNAVSEYDEILGYVDYIMGERANAQFIILGDFNCNYFDSAHPFSASLNDFKNSRDLLCTFSLMDSFQPGHSYTRYDARSRSLLDYIFISSQLRENVSNVVIGNYHDNFSDHLTVEVDLNLTLAKGGNVYSNSTNQSRNIIWSKLSSSNLAEFSATMEVALDLINIPSSVSHGSCLCTDDSHKFDIEMYCTEIVDAIRYADSVLERSVFHALKPFWTRELSALKRQSFTCHKIWLDNGKPMVGVIYDDYVRSRSEYRQILRREKKKTVSTANDKLYESLVDKDSAKFWRTWKSLSQSKDPLPPRIDGHTDDSSISDCFSRVFSDIYRKNDVESHNSLRNKFESIFPAYYNAHIHDDISQFYFSWQDMFDMVAKLKVGKSYAGFIRAEHILNGSPKLIAHLHILFNAMLQHSFVPSLLLRGNITPLVKDRDGDASDSSNYRAITLSSIFIQMFEILEKSKFGYFLSSSPLQFGFKPKVSTNHALYTLKRTVDYFTDNKSRVFLAFLDCSKAFDRISHWGLFIKLIERNVPLCFLLGVIFLYLNMDCTVKWNNRQSGVFDIPSGTKQGGILSPDFFALYIDELISILKNSGYGCHAISLCIACIFFADDMVLLSPSRYGLQKMLNICVDYCSKYCLDFNVKKSQVMLIGTEPSELGPLFLNDTPLEYVSEYKYLGVTLNGDKELKFLPVCNIRSFHRAANSILCSRVKPNKKVLMRLLYTNCVPIITYGCAVKEFSAADMYRCHVAVNNAIRRIVSFAVWQSIRHIRISYGYKSIYEIFQLAKKNFKESALTCSNSIVRHLAVKLPLA